MEAGAVFCAHGGADEKRGMNIYHIKMNIIDSPVLGKIPPIGLSGGIKTLILVKFEPEKVFSVSTCGDNCAKRGGIMPMMAKAAATRGGVVCGKSAPGTMPMAKKAARQSPQALPGGRCLIG